MLEVEGVSTNPLEEIRKSRERKSIAHAIAGRTLNETMRFTQFLQKQQGLPVQQLPRFFKDALVDAYATDLLPWMRMPNPYVAFFTDRSHLVDNVSIGDFVELQNRSPEQPGLTVEQQILLAKVQMQSMMDQDSLVGPEHQFVYMTNMLQVAVTAEKRTAIPIQRMYRNEEHYGHLMRETFTPEIYRDEWQKSVKKIDFRTAVKPVAIQYTQYESLKETGELLKGDELKDKYLKFMGSALDDDDSFNQVNAALEKLPLMVDDFATSQIERFWGHEEEPSPVELIGY